MQCHSPSVSIPYRPLSFDTSHIKRNTFFLLSRPHDSSSASYTPSWAEIWEAGSASSLNSVATYSGVHTYPITLTGRTSATRSRQPTSTATVHAMVGAPYSMTNLKHVASRDSKTRVSTLSRRNRRPFALPSSTSYHTSLAATSSSTTKSKPRATSWPV
jgi:hypothetical protein